MVLGRTLRTWLGATGVVRERCAARGVLDVAAGCPLVGNGHAAGNCRDGDELDEEEELARHGVL